MEISMSSGTALKDEPKWPVIPENELVDVEVVKVELREISPEFRARYGITDESEISFSFKITEGEFKNQWIFGSAKPYLNDSDTCRLRHWLTAIYGLDQLPDDYTLRLDENNVAPDLTGLRCRVLVRNKTKQDGTKAHAVKDVLRASGTKNFLTEESF